MNNVAAFNILYGKTNVTIEEKTSKTNKNYLLVKRSFKGEGYIKSTMKNTRGFNGFKSLHGLIIWFNEHSCTVKPITCRTFKSTKGFSRKEYKQLADSHYGLPENYRRKSNTGPHMDYLKEKLKDAPWRVKFKIHKPIITMRKCKNGKDQVLVSDWNSYKTMRIKTFTAYDRGYSRCTHGTVLFTQLEELLPEEQATILTKMLLSKMNSYAKTLEPKK